MIIVGVSAFYHEAACCLIKDGQLLAGAAEERFSRMKHDPRLPTRAFQYCLKQAGIHPGQIDAVAYYEQPVLKLSRQLAQRHLAVGSGTLEWLDPQYPLEAMRKCWGLESEIVCFPHHLSHAASSFFYSGFNRAAVLVVDGVGEWATTSYGSGEGTHLGFFAQVDFPHSLGLWYATLTAYLGFRVNNGEYKVMGLAPYGKPKYLKEMRHLLRSWPGPEFELELKYYDFIEGGRMFSEELLELFGKHARQPQEPVTQFHKDVARSLQVHLEEILLEKAEYLYERTKESNLCLAGGVALNCVANGRLHRQSSFKNIFVQPAAGDDGGCLGAAALAHVQLTGKVPFENPQRHCFIGPSYTVKAIHQLLEELAIPYLDFRDNEQGLAETIAEKLAGNQVVGHFHGRMEMGPRALGARSILANPMDPTIRERLNLLVKKRESFRPFAPSVLNNQAKDHFDLGWESPFMLETCQVKSTLELPGITHVDGSARPQTVSAQDAPRFAKIIEAFYQQTQCPMVVNTSFNLRGEPIVNRPDEALRCAVRANLDALVLGDFVITRDAFPKAWASLADYGWRADSHSNQHRHDVLVENLYSFV